LTEKPSIYFFLLILGLTFYIANKGIETLTRVSIISILVAFSIFIFDYTNLIKDININNFLPLITVSYKNIIKSSIIYALFSSIPPMFVMSIKKDDLIDKNNFNKLYYKMYTLSFISLFIAITFTIGVFGINLASLFDYPLYTVLKKIEIFSFLDSLENISVMLWILYSINAAASVLLCIFNNLKEALTLNKKKEKYMKISVMIITLIITFIFYNKYSYIESYDYIKYPLYVTLTMLIIICLTIIINKIKFKRS
ncbi:MAG: GerAB/ArcD/ProY family transporter, partial [Bacilli bacterium]